MKNIKPFNFFSKNESLEGFPMLRYELDTQEEEFDKVEALRYVIRTADPKISDVTTKASIYNIIKFLIQSPNESFTKEFLNNQIDRALKN